MLCNNMFRIAWWRCCRQGRGTALRELADLEGQLEEQRKLASNFERKARESESSEKSERKTLYSILLSVDNLYDRCRRIELSSRRSAQENPARSDVVSVPSSPTTTSLGQTTSAAASLDTGSTEQSQIKHRFEPLTEVPKHLIIIQTVLVFTIQCVLKLVL